jgi:hypothetical protein
MSITTALGHGPLSLSSPSRGEASNAFVANSLPAKQALPFPEPTEGAMLAEDHPECGGSRLEIKEKRL